MCGVSREAMGQRTERSDPSSWNGGMNRRRRKEARGEPVMKRAFGRELGTLSESRRDGVIGRYDARHSAAY